MEKEAEHIFKSLVFEQSDDAKKVRDSDEEIQ